MITMPGVQGLMDHRAVGVKGRRLFVPANRESRAEIRRCPARESDECEVSGLEPTTLVFHRAAVRTRCRRLYWLALQGLGPCHIYVMRRPEDVFHVIRWTVIDRAIVNDHALWIDDDHLRSCLSVERMADCAC